VRARAGTNLEADMTPRFLIAPLAVLGLALAFAPPAASQCGGTVFDCPDDIVVTGCGPNGAVVNYDAPTASSECGPVELSLFRGLPSGATFP
jgi:hypothetical protein